MMVKVLAALPLLTMGVLAAGPADLNQLCDAIKKPLQQAPAKDLCTVSASCLDISCQWKPPAASIGPFTILGQTVGPYSAEVLGSYISAVANITLNPCKAIPEVKVSVEVPPLKVKWAQTFTAPASVTGAVGKSQLVATNANIDTKALLSAAVANLNAAALAVAKPLIDNAVLPKLAVYANVTTSNKNGEIKVKVEVTLCDDTTPAKLVCGSDLKIAGFFSVPSVPATLIEQDVDFSSYCAVPSNPNSSAKVAAAEAALNTAASLAPFSGLLAALMVYCAFALNH